MEKDNKNALTLAIGVMFILTFVYAINPLIRGALAIYMVLLGTTITVYAIRNYQKNLIGLSTKNLWRSMLIAGLISFGFYLVTRIVPGLSLGLPLVPNAISDQLRFFVVVLVAPIVEELFFRGSLLGYLRSFTSPSKKRKFLAILVTSIVFALFHLTAYIYGFYSLPGFSSALVAFSANMSAFVSAFIFAMIAGYLAVETDNLWSSMALHLLLNLIIYTSLTVAFLG